MSAHLDNSDPNSLTSNSRNRTMDNVRPYTKLKLCCVGDGGVGKTCLLIMYAENRFPADYVPTVFENYVTRVPYGDKVLEFALWDTAGQEEYDRLRPLSYPETDVLLICFSCDYPVSLENVEEKWWPEVVHFLEDVPMILVATKTDLRTDQRSVEMLKAQGRKPITTAEGQTVARRIGAKYAEVSAIQGIGVQEVFDLAIKEGMKGRGILSGALGIQNGLQGIKKSTKKCRIL